MKTIDDYIEDHKVQLENCDDWWISSSDVEKIMKEFARDIIRECANRSEAITDNNGNAIPATAKIISLINELD